MRTETILQNMDLQTERLMSDREMFGRAEDLSVFAIPFHEAGESNERCPLTLNFNAKSEAERAFELPSSSNKKKLFKGVILISKTLF